MRRRIPGVLNATWRLLTGVALPVVLGCATDPSDEPAEYALDTQAQWGGGTVVVRSASFSGRSHLPLIMVEAETLEVSRVDAERLLVRLPQRSSGDVILVLHEGARSDTIGTVRLFGYVRQSQFSPGFEYSVLVLGRRDGERVVLGNGMRGGLTVFSPSTGTSEAITGLRAPSGYYGVGYTHHASRFVLRDSAGTLGIWELWPQTVRVGDWPFTHYLRHLAQLGPSQFLSGHSHQTWTTDTISPSQVYGPFSIEDSWMTALSPRGDRAVLASVTSPPGVGVPVFNSLTGDAAFMLPGVANIAWAAFSADGGMLYLAGRGTTPGDSLRSIDATTGAQLASAPLPGPVATLAADPAGRVLFLSLWTTSAPRLVIYDAATLTLVGDLPAPGPPPTGTFINNGWEGQIVADRSQGKVWIVWNGEPAKYFEFDMLP